MTSAYHPQANGLVERLNGTIVEILRSSLEVDKCQKDWTEKLPLAIFAYNSAVQDSIHFSPFFLRQGREPKLPMDVITETNLKPADTVLPSSPVKPAPELPLTRRGEIRSLQLPLLKNGMPEELPLEHLQRLTSLNEARMQALDNLEQCQLKQKDVIDQYRKSVSIEPGDLAILRDDSPNIPKRPGKRVKKLLPTYKGPYKVISKPSDLTLEIEVITGNGRITSDTVHISRCKKYFSRVTLRPVAAECTLVNMDRSVFGEPPNLI